MKHATYRLLSLSLIAICVAIMPIAAHAQDDGGGYDDGTTYNGGCCGDSGSSSYDYTQPSYDSGYTYTPDTYTTGSDTSFSGSLGLGGSSYLGSGYGSSYPYSSYSNYGYGSSYPVSYPTGGGSNVNVNTNVNTISTSNACTGSNVCNTTTSTVTNPTPVYTQPIYTQPIYTQPIYTQPIYTQPIVINRTVAYTPPQTVYIPPTQPASPYITLSQVPYTGLDLGTWGTALYWGFIALMALLAAYLIVLKRVQNTIAKKVSIFLFGETETADNFILSQISRY